MLVQVAASFTGTDTSTTTFTMAQDNDTATDTDTDTDTDTAATDTNTTYDGTIGKQVYEVKCRVTGHVYACKTMAKKNNPLWLQEAQLLNKCDHPGETREKKRRVYCCLQFVVCRLLCAVCRVLLPTQTSLPSTSSSASRGE